MAKRQLVVCCDGTWNDPASSTNIWQTYMSICGLKSRLPNDNKTWDEKIGNDRRVVWRQGVDGATIIAYYDSGVGAAPGQKLRGGGLGAGLSANVQQAYEFLARYGADKIDPYADDASGVANREAADSASDIEIYLFGFSRGAHTVRSLCGFVRAAGGLIAPRDLASTGTAFELYRMAPEERIGSAPQATIDVLERRPVTIRCLGVYDTVGALGVPLPAYRFFDWLFPNVTRFHDTMLSSIIENAFRALAIDERRGPFAPSLWTAAPGTWQRGQESGPQHILQCWFAGAHCDVGGGYNERALADISLGWMLRRAMEVGLDLPDDVLRPGDVVNPLAERHDSFQKWRLLHTPENNKSANVLANDIAPILSMLSFGGLLTVTDVAMKIFKALRLTPAPRVVGGEQRDKDSDRLGFCIGEYVHESVRARCKRGYSSAILEPAAAQAAPTLVERRAPRRPVASCPATLRFGSYDTPQTNAITINARIVDLSRAGAQVALSGLPPSVGDTGFFDTPNAEMLPPSLRRAPGAVPFAVKWVRRARAGLAFAA